jgi:hypothetical protein
MRAEDRAKDQDGTCGGEAVPPARQPADLLLVTLSPSYPG